MRRYMQMFAFVLVLIGSQFCLASSITLTSSGGGTYDYGLTLDQFEAVVFNPDQTITLSGMTGVTGASVSGDLNAAFTVSSFDSTSVVFAQTKQPFYFLFSVFGPATFGTFTVDSSTLTLGTINFSMVTADGTVTGSTQGPSPVPEPASLVLLGTGLLGIIGVARRRTMPSRMGA